MEKLVPEDNNDKSEKGIKNARSNSMDSFCDTTGRRGKERGKQRTEELAEESEGSADE